MLSREQKNNLGGGLTKYIAILGGAIAILWLLEIADWIMPGQIFDSFGIRPRTADGFRNIIFAPFLHYGFDHLIGNTIPFIILGGLVIIRRVSDFIWVSVIAGIISGLGIWLFGFSNTVHLGASGVVFGYMGYLLLRGYFERSIPAIAIALFAGFLYGGMLFGLIMPFQPGISWLGHFFGFLGGGLAAYWMVEGER